MVANEETIAAVRGVLDRFAATYSARDEAGALGCFDVGSDQMEFELTPDAIDLGLDAAVPSVVELGSKVAEFGRGERLNPDRNDLLGTVRTASPRAPSEPAVLVA